MGTKNQVYDRITKDINEWDISHYWATHKPSKVTYWIANGFPFFTIESGVKINIGLWNKIKLWYWIKSAKNKQFLKALDHKEEQSNG